MNIAHGPAETMPSLMPSVGVAVAGVLAELNGVDPGVLAILESSGL
jgi:hypothetical protein